MNLECRKVLWPSFTYGCQGLKQSLNSFPGHYLVSGVEHYVFTAAIFLRGRNLGSMQHNMNSFGLNSKPNHVLLHVVAMHEKGVGKVVRPVRFRMLKLIRIEFMDSNHLGRVVATL